MSNAIIFEKMTASITSRCDFENSQISAQDTLVACVAGDDITYHILVIVYIYWCMSPHLLRVYIPEDTFQSLELYSMILPPRDYILDGYL